MSLITRVGTGSASLRDQVGGLRSGQDRVDALVGDLLNRRT